MPGSAQGRVCIGGWGLHRPPFPVEMWLRAGGCSRRSQINGWVWAQSRSAVCTDGDVDINMLVSNEEKYLYGTVKQCHYRRFGKPGQEKQHGQVRRKGLREGGKKQLRKKKKKKTDFFKGKKKVPWVPAVPKPIDMQRVGFLEIVRKERDGKSSIILSISPWKQTSFCFQPRRGIHNTLRQQKPPRRRQGIPSAWLTATLMQMPRRRDATRSACKAFYCREALTPSSVVLKCWPAPCPLLAELWRGLRHAWKK